METVEKMLLYAAACVGLLAPVAAFVFFRRAYAHIWLTELQKYQALAGAFVALFAASLGTLGVLLNIRTQRLNTDRQISAQRLEQDRARLIARQQVASAFRLAAPTTYYLSSPGNVGLFPGRILEELTRFYNRAAMIPSDLEKCASAAEEVALHGKLPATTSMDWIVYSLKRALANIDLCIEGGRSLVRALGEIRNAPSM